VYRVAQKIWSLATVCQKKCQIQASRAMHMRCGGILIGDNFITGFLLTEF